MINSNEFFKDLDEFRTPQQMRAYFEGKKAKIISNKALNDLARLKIGKYKEFLEEFYPIYLFSQSKYVPDNAQVRIVLGNQSYDVIVKYDSGLEKKYEITGFIYGQDEREDAKLINQRGYSKIRMYDTKDLELKAYNYLEEVILNAKKKAHMNYNGVAIIILLDVYYYLEIWNLDMKRFIDNAIERIRELPFSSNEVYIMVRNSDPVYLIDKNIYRVI
ncbi:hypothetical protein HNQ94_001213 [Salirhabdus euzebyi]|uniref:Uncharacterized protein n=1 Tax=Salirhabdus euzebyi TaxID=394506 RepID=A0A841PUT3_9BACI|nr:hypothetical protein [Salirhabdus euzebyi]MBB6452767.1 hypothetical protein [Salirhabdus euzebyi]